VDWCDLAEVAQFCTLLHFIIRTMSLNRVNDQDEDGFHTNLREIFGKVDERSVALASETGNPTWDI
tara:strand:+ start:200 stop:397 length:198 start_codon:yes stop_codon:yes gene_type:complete